MARTFTVPDLYDGNRRIPRDAIVRARRCDTHTTIDEEATIDQYGNATFSTLPEGVDVVFHTLWHGVTGYGNYRWFFSHIVSVSEGGTGASTAEDARKNLGLEIGVDVQAWDEDLDAIAALAKTDSNFIVADGSTWVAESGQTARNSMGIPGAGIKWAIALGG
jgi:hypothetical protein